MGFTTPGKIDLEFRLALANWIHCQNASQCRQGAHTQHSPWEKGSHLLIRWSLCPEMVRMAYKLSSKFQAYS